MNALLNVVAHDAAEPLAPFVDARAYDEEASRTLAIDLCNRKFAALKLFRDIDRTPRSLAELSERHQQHGKIWYVGYDPGHSVAPPFPILWCSDGELPLIEALFDGVEDFAERWRARAEGEEALRRAREEADRALSGLASRREVMIGQLQEMQQRLLDVARELETTIDRDEAVELPQMPTVPPTTETRAAVGSTDPGSSDSGTGAPGAGADPIDPRYEDLWSSGETEGGETVDLNLADLGDLDLSLGEDSPGEKRRS